MNVRSKTILIGSALATLAVAALIGRPIASHQLTALEGGSAEPVERPLPQTVGGKGVASTTGPQGQSNVLAVAGEVVVKSTNPQALATYGAVRSAGAPQTFVVSVSQSADPAQTAATIRTAPGVQAAGPNYVAKAALTPNDSLFASSQSNLTRIAMPAAWDKTTGSSGTVVASLDTGINWNHADLTGKVKFNSSDTAGNGIDDDGNGTVDDTNGMDFVNANFVGGKYVNDSDGPADDEGHGTLTASVFAANTNNGQGIAAVGWQTRTLAVKVLGNSGYGSFVDVANGIRYATDNGAKVINMSLGAQGVTSDFNTDSAISYAISHGVTVVAATGNDAATTVSYPANNANVIAVGASDNTDTVANYSNQGTQVSVVAPGNNIPSANRSGGYSSASGTSLATPHVAGAAALMLAAKPALTPAQVKQTLQNTTDKPAGMSGQNRTNAYGYGRLNVNQALGTTPAYAASYVRQSTNPTVSTGQQTTVSVDYTNTGTQTWQSTGANAVKLGTSNPRDRGSGLYATSWESPSRAGSFVGTVDGNQVVTPASTVAPGQTARFEFTVTGPPVSGASLNEVFEPVVEGITWLGSPATYVVTIPGRSYAYQPAGQVNPPDLNPGQETVVSIDLKNTGSAYWRRDGLYPTRLGTGRPTDRGSGFAKDWLSPNRVSSFVGRVDSGSVTNTDVIAPNEIARFQFTIKALDRYGFFPEHFQPVVERVSYLADTGIYLPINIPTPPPPYAYQITGQSAYPTIEQGQSATLQLNVKNTGSATWASNGQTPVRLATDRPTDRGSGFSQAGSGLSAGWLSVNRIKLTRNLTDSSKNAGGETTIAPGETGQFEFVMTANVPPGYHPEFFRVIAEGVTTMPPAGIWWGVNVPGGGQPIRVAVSNQASASMSSTGPVTLVTEAGETLATIPTAQPFGFTWTGSNYVVDTAAGQFIRTSPVHAQGVSGAVITVNNQVNNPTYNRFRGDLYLKNGSPGAWLVNHVRLEDYLKGMGEVPDSWPLEAIKAQQVAARTYAARKITGPRNEVFDIYDTTTDQVYNGFVAEQQKPNHTPATNQTSGIVVYYAGQLAQTFYSSDTGGATANSEDVYGGAYIPYLRAIADPYEKPDVWDKGVTQATLQQNYGHPGNVDAINVTAYYAGGRIKTLQLVTNGGAVTNHTLPADTHRTRLGLRSSRLDRPFGRTGNDWIFRGRGFGHGLGMGQYGAFNQANQGRNYQQILSFYYQGINFGSF